MSIRFSNLKHIYQSPAAEARLILDIPAWEIADASQVLLKGVSGSGKTTLFNIVAGLMAPSQGEVFLDNQSLYQLAEAPRDRFRANHIGYVFQTHYLLPTLTALENVIMPMAFAGQVPSKQWKKRATEMLARVGLGDHLNYKPAKLSTGQRLRVAVARAMVNAPRLLLADEPTAALDTEAAVSIMDMMQNTCRDHGAIFLVASHDPALDVRFPIIARLVEHRVQLQETEPA